MRCFPFFLGFLLLSLFWRTCGLLSDFFFNTYVSVVVEVMNGVWMQIIFVYFIAADVFVPATVGGFLIGTLFVLSGFGATEF